MTRLKDVSYTPIPENQLAYDELYALYRQLHDAFGGVSKTADLAGIMPALIHFKERAHQPLAANVAADEFATPV